MTFVATLGFLLTAIASMFILFFHGLTGIGMDKRTEYLVISILFMSYVFLGILVWSVS